MDQERSEAYLGACMIAKRTTEFLPTPPNGLQRRHIYILKTCYHLKETNGTVKISDIAKAIKGTLPSVTKNVATLEELGYIVRMFLDSMSKMQKFYKKFLLKIWIRRFEQSNESMS